MNSKHFQPVGLYIFKLYFKLLYLKFIIGMNFTTVGKSYGSPTDQPPTAYNSSYQESSSRPSDYTSYSVSEALRIDGLGDSASRFTNNQNSLPTVNVQINRVQSKEYLEKSDRRR